MNFELGDMVQVNRPGNPKDGHIGRLKEFSVCAFGCEVVFDDGEKRHYNSEDLSHPRQCMQKTLPDSKLT